MWWDFRCSRFPTCCTAPASFPLLNWPAPWTVLTDKIEILIDRAGPLVRAAVVEDGRLTDLHIDSDDRPSRLGSIVLGRVERIVTALNGAFIDIAGPSAGLLNAGDLRAAAPTSRKAARVR